MKVAASEGHQHWSVDWIRYLNSGRTNCLLGKHLLWHVTRLDISNSKHQLTLAAARAQCAAFDSLALENQCLVSFLPFLSEVVQSPDTDGVDHKMLRYHSVLIIITLLLMLSVQSAVGPRCYLWPLFWPSYKSLKMGLNLRKEEPALPQIINDYMIHPISSCVSHLIFWVILVDVPLSVEKVHLQLRFLLTKCGTSSLFSKSQVFALKS